MLGDCRKAGVPVRETLLLSAGWLAGWYLLARLPGLAPLAALAEESAALAGVSVVIPARNEEANLRRLLPTLAAQAPAPGEVIVVDDRSADATAVVANQAGATVVAGADTPDGWGGKCWACHQGAVAARGDRLVFLDADVTLAPDALARLAAEHDRRGGLLSVAPFHETRRPYEQLSAVANAVALMGTGAFAADRPTADRPTPDRPTAATRRTAMAFGPCLIMSVEDYRRIGGHEAVQRAVAEDVALARRFRAAGLPVHVLAGRDAVAYRMYPDGPTQLFDGWTRVLAAGAGATPLPRAAAIGAWVTAALLAAAGPARPRRRRRRRTALAWYGAFSLQAWWMFRRIGRFGAVTALAYPAPLTTFVALCARSAFRRLRGRPPTWRGREMPGVSRSRS